MSSFSDKAKSIIKAVAPTVAAALPGPFGPLAGVIVAKALGVDNKNPADKDAAVAAALATGDPEILLKLRQAEQDFTARMAELGLKPEQLANEDRANARAREMTIRDHTPAILAYGITAGFFGTLAWLLAYGKPVTGGDALLVMLGSLGTAWAGITAYYFGSSSGSKQKDAALADIARMP